MQFTLLKIELPLGRKKDEIFALVERVERVAIACRILSDGVAVW